MTQQSDEIKALKEENQNLLVELETAYKNMASILEQSEKEKEIAYRELEIKFKALEDLYTQLSNKENMLVHMEKLSSIGQFITEIIHELKNPLTVISGVSDLVLLDTKISSEQRERISKIPKQVKRMTNYLNRFKAMAYKGKEDFRIFDLNENVRDFLETIEIIKPKNILIDSDLCSGPLKILGDPYQITQIFLNLAKNAFDAMKPNGTKFLVRSHLMDTQKVSESLTKMTSCQSSGNWQKIINEKDQFAVLDFRDDGSGIPEELVSEIFEAFFTTKERGKGTGLGLSIATDITLRHNANLMVESVLNQGTTFRFIIPLSVENSEKQNLVVTSKELFF